MNELGIISILKKIIYPPVLFLLAFMAAVSVFGVFALSLTLLPAAFSRLACCAVPHCSVQEG